MFTRTLLATAAAELDHVPAVVLLGPRQVGKTTLALALAATRPSVYLDLQSEADRAKLVSPELYLAGHDDKLVILDEIQHAPGLLPVLRGLIDKGRRAGRAAGRFLLLGSASIALLRQSGETLAGRVAYLELAPLTLDEAGDARRNALWLRGGFPESLLARDDVRSLRWRQNFIRSYLERDVPQLGPRIAAETLRRFWTMLAHHQGGIVNAAALARSLGVDGKTVAAYLDLMVDLLLTWPGGDTWAIEVKRSLAPRLERGFRSACDDVQPQRRFVVYPGVERYRMATDVEALPLEQLVTMVGGAVG